MKQVEIDMSNVDWGMLRKQKETLIESAAVAPKSFPRISEEHLKGLIHLLDYIQDRAAEILGEKIVYGENE